MALKPKDVISWFNKHITDGKRPYTLDKDQAKVVLDAHKNTLVTARAGSGKTRTIVAKVVFLIAHEKVLPEEILIFAFNRKARAEVNERLSNMNYDGEPIFGEFPRVATTFHAYAFQMLKNVSKKPKFFVDDGEHFYSQMLVEAARNIPNKTNYNYIFIDEYQDFAALFLIMIRALRESCPEAHLLAVGDDWQAINRFAGSELKFFRNFSDFFPEDSTQLFLLSNYRSGKKIVKNANYFMGEMLNDFQGGKPKQRMKSGIFVCNINRVVISNKLMARDELPFVLRKYLVAIGRIIRENPGKTVKILHRNNDLSFRGWSLDMFCEILVSNLISKGVLSKVQAYENITWSTVHRSKGLEADIVILMELDPDVFPGRLDRVTRLSNSNIKTSGLMSTPEFDDEIRLFYVALTRAKEKMYIFTKSLPRPGDKRNFLNYLNPNLVSVVYL